MSTREAWLVVDLGFGDAGKGTVTDFLVRARGARAVVRFNGGAQAGHNVVTADGRHHTFAQLGSGSFVPGVRTHLPRHVVVHPAALLVEARRLERVGVHDALARVSVHRDALAITPFHQAANRLRELARGEGAHGTCGVGVGETVADALAGADDVVRVGDLWDPAALRPRLKRLQARKRAELDEALRALAGRETAERERQVLEAEDVSEAWLDALAPLCATRVAVGDAEERALLGGSGALVFEGAQGVLLDEWRGFHPHTTWSTCTFENARTVLESIGWDGAVTRMGVLRAYATRHGQGPFPTEDVALRAALPEPHNASTGWQGTFRVGWLDGVLLRYALAACGGADLLAVTHLDRVQPERWRVCGAYRVGAGSEEAGFFERAGGESEGVVGIRLGPPRDLGYQERLGRALRSVEPVYEELAPGAEAEGLLKWVEARAGVPVGLASFGPTAEGKRWRKRG